MNTTVAERDAHALAVIETSVREAEPSIRDVLPTHIPVARVIDTVLTAARRTPDLLQCTPASFVYAMREAARWGLLPDGVMGQGYLIPRRNGRTGEMEATFQAGYRGLEDLARRSGVVASIVSGWACANDPVFNVRLGLHGDVEHVPALANRGAIIGFYAAAWLNNGAPPVVVYLPESEVIALRDSIAGWQKGPWRTHFAAMGRKTAVRRLIGQLPLNPDVQDIIGAEDEGFERAVNVTPTGEKVEPAPEVRAAVALLPSHRVTPQAREVTDGESAPEPTPEVETVSGTVQLEERPGLDGLPTEVAGGMVIGFRLNREGDDWVQVVLSGPVYERYGTATPMVESGAMIRVTGRKVIVPRLDAEGPPLVRIIATEDIEWQSD